MVARWWWSNVSSTHKKTVAPQGATVFLCVDVVSRTRSLTRGKKRVQCRKSENKWLKTWKIKIIELSLQQIRNERMSNDNTQQIPPQGDNRENEVGGLLAAASDFARGVLESIQALAGTTSCKGVQIVRLKDWAVQHGCWIDRCVTYQSWHSKKKKWK